MGCLGDLFRLRQFIKLIFGHLQSNLQWRFKSRKAEYFSCNRENKMFFPFDILINCTQAETKLPKLFNVHGSKISIPP